MTPRTLALALAARPRSPLAAARAGPPRRRRAPAPRPRDARHPLPDVQARERAHRDPPRGPHEPDRRAFTSSTTSARRTRSPGRTGFAHLFEHLMFQGSRAPAEGRGRPAHRGRRRRRATARPRRTPPSTGSRSPSNALEQMLFIESDRMGFLLPTLTQDKLDNQRDVVRNERRQNYEMRPYGLAFEKILANLWNPEFPYHWMPIGSHEDLAGGDASRTCSEFFKRWYGPENAVLAIAGDVDPARARALVEKWFGAIPGKPPPAAPAARAGAARAPRSGSRWRTGCSSRASTSPGRRRRSSPPGDAALDLAGQVLSDGKSARLVKRLVMDERIAQDVSAGQMSQALGSHVPRRRDAEAGRLARAAREGDRRGARAPRRGAARARRSSQRAKNKHRGGRDLRRSSRWAGSAAAPPRSPATTCAPGTPATSTRTSRATARSPPRTSPPPRARFLRKDARVVLTVVPRRRRAGGPPPHARRREGGAPMIRRPAAAAAAARSPLACAARAPRRRRGAARRGARRAPPAAAAAAPPPRRPARTGRSPARERARRPSCASRRSGTSRSRTGSRCGSSSTTGSPSSR